MYSRNSEILLEFQNTIEHAPITPQQQYANACSNDKTTIDTWKPKWIAQVAENHARFGPFKDKTLGSVRGLYAGKPVIVAGSGPSLGVNVALMKDRPPFVGLISCLHNFHLMEDNGIVPDMFVTLDAGDVTIEEVSEGGSKTPEEYWAATEKHTLAAFIGSPPKLIEKWRGKILFFNCPIPDESVMAEFDKSEKFHLYVSTGGNVLGASMYIAKAFMGANPVIFTGADFSFGYKKKFHAWDSKYDAKLGNVLKATDVFGNKVLTWGSYWNFKCWFDWVCQSVPGIWINASEGGCLGAYAEGNIACIRQMGLKDVFDMYNIYSHTKAQSENPDCDDKLVLF